MSLSELRREARMAPRGDAAQTPQRASWIYHLTFALPIAPLVLAVLALTLRRARHAESDGDSDVRRLLSVVLMATEALVYKGLPPARRRMDTKRDVRCGCGVFRVIAAVEHPRFVTPRPMIPGRALHRLAARLCSAKTLERVVEPAIADLQKEYAAPVRRRGHASGFCLPAMSRF